MMRAVVLSLALFLACGGTLTMLAPFARAQSGVGLHTDQETAARIRAALDEETTLEVLESPLEEVVDYLSQLHNIEITLDQRAMEDVGLGSDTPVTRTLKKVSLRSALRIMLRDLSLDFSIRHGALQITTREATESQLITRVYQVDDLLKRNWWSDGKPADFDGLVDVIENTIAPEYWDTVGGPATMQGVLGNLVVSQTLENHRQLEDFLATYRQTLKLHDANPSDPVKSVSIALDASDARTMIMSKLNTRLDIDFIETPLSEVVEFLRQATGVPIIIDRRALDNVGIGTDTPITISAKKIRLRDAFGRFLERHELSYRVADETLQITTPEETEAFQPVRFYPIHDLLSGDDDDRATLIDQLQWVITSTVQPEAWDEVGGPGTLQVLPPGVLVIRQTDEVHDEISGLIHTIRKQKVVPVATGKKYHTEAYVIYDPADPNSPATPEMVEQLVADLSELAPEVDWKQSGTYRRAFGATLVIRHTRAAHRATRAVLQSIRPQRGHMPAPTGMNGRGFGEGGQGFGGGGAGAAGGLFAVPPTAATPRSK